MLGKISDRQIGIFGAILGVIGLVLSIYFYIATIAERRPIFLLDDTSRAVIATKAEIPHGTVNITRSDGKKIENDINVAKFYFWNEGSIPIKAEEILKPIRLRVEKGEILSFKINKVSRDVVNAAVTADIQGAIVFSLNILEQSDGFSGQIIYEGPKDAKILLDGVIQGVGEIDFCSCVVPKRPWYILSMLALYLFSLGLVIRVVYKAWLDRKQITRIRVLVLWALLFLVVVSIFDNVRKFHEFSKISAEPPSSILHAG